MQLFLSDLHLEQPQAPQFAALCALLERERSRCQEIYFLGDLTEVWVGDDDDGPLAIALSDLLAKTARYCRVYVMHGNRDFLFGERFAQRTSTTLISDPLTLDSHTLLAHGDSFCIDDEAYQSLRNTLRSSEWQQQVLALSLPERRNLAAGMRQESQKANANKAANIMDVNTPAIDQLMQSTGCSLLIHGHTHRPGVHQHSWGSRYVLGDWDRCGWLVRRSEEHCQLECFALHDQR